MISISCTAGYGSGGLGRHLAQLVETARAAGELDAYYTPGPRPADDRGTRIESSLPRHAATLAAKLSPGWRHQLGSVLFDRHVARAINPVDTHIGFSGQALKTFEALRGKRLELISPTAHVDLLVERYETAYRTHPIERPWLNEAGRRRALAEYEHADIIHVSSTYAADSFLAAGIPEERLHRVDLELPERFRPTEPRRDDGVFRVIYVGSLTVTKGVPVLLDTFGRLSDNVELALVGGWGTRSMRRFIEQRMAEDRRISLVAGDPLDHLRTADVLVHPSYSDGFGYAPMEALACGVPVIVTEDTGMKEHVREGVNGYVVATGDTAALSARLSDLRERPLRSPSSLLLELERDAVSARL